MPRDPDRELLGNLLASYGAKKSIYDLLYQRHAAQVRWNNAQNDWAINLGRQRKYDALCKFYETILAGCIGLAATVLSMGFAGFLIAEAGGAAFLSAEWIVLTLTANLPATVSLRVFGVAFAVSNHNRRQGANSLREAGLTVKLNAALEAEGRRLSQGSRWLLQTEFERARTRLLGKALDSIHAELRRKGENPSEHNSTQLHGLASSLVSSWLSAQVLRPSTSDMIRLNRELKGLLREVQAQTRATTLRIRRAEESARGGHSVRESNGSRSWHPTGAHGRIPE